MCIRDRSKIVNLEEQVQEKEKKLSELQSDFKIQMSEIKNKELKSQETLQKREKTIKNIYNGVKRLSLIHI